MLKSGSHFDIMRFSYSQIFAGHHAVSISVLIASAFAKLFLFLSFPLLARSHLIAAACECSRTISFNDRIVEHHHNTLRLRSVTLLLFRLLLLPLQPPSACALIRSLRTLAVR